MHLALNPLDANDLISTFGLAGLLVVLFAETGLLIGFFLPGDTLLFLAGAITVHNADPKLPHLPLAGVLIGSAVAAVIGAQVGWWIGRKSGPLLFDRPRSRFFDPHNVQRAHNVLERYGVGKAVVLARFIPLVRTFMNPVCGVAEVPGRVFLIWNVIGGVLWTQLVVLLGRALGPTVHIEKYILPIVAAIAVLSVLTVLFEARRSARRARQNPRPEGVRLPQRETSL